ncbi:MAG: hypothetical protein JWO30_1670 [Fibrobacteres bacterium]|nr:hypothetical protein [Fibrobacterota bacterium]
MNPTHSPRPMRITLLGTALIGAFLVGGCALQDKASGTETVSIDPFPKPLGEAIIPLEQEAFSSFKYVEFDTAGGLVMRKDLDLHIIPKGQDRYGYAFEDPRHGYLLTWKDGNGNRDSAGVYIIGSFRDTSLAIDSNPVLWLPQFPKPGVSWSIEPGRVMDLISADTAFYTDILFQGSDEVEKAPIERGFQKQPTLLFRETYGDTLTYYHFRRGVGCLGFERSTRGKLLATGYIQTFSGKSRYGSGPLYGL